MVSEHISRNKIVPRFAEKKLMEKIENHRGIVLVAMP